MGQLIEKEVEQLKDRFQFSAEMIEKWKKRNDTIFSTPSSTKYYQKQGSF